MNDVLQHLLITIIISLSCIAINAVTWEGMIFEKLANKVEKLIIRITSLNIGTIICKPLFRCPMCMASFWTLVYWIVLNYQFNPILMMLTVCGLNIVLVAIIINIMPNE